MYVLLFAVKNYKPAVAVATAYIYPLSFKQFIKQICAYIAQISCKDNVVILGLCPRIAEKFFYGARCGGGKCQENTINFLKLIFFGIYACFKTSKMGAAMGVLMLNIHHMEILLCDLYKKVSADLTSNFVDENFISKTNS